METANEQMVLISAGKIIVVKPKQEMTKEEALCQAAWLVAMASEDDGDFQRILEVVKNPQ